MRTVELGDLVLVVPSEPALAAGALRVRNALEPLVAAEAARHAEPGDVRELEGLLAEMEARHEDPAAFLRANWALHRRLAGLVRNPVLADVYTTTLALAEAQISSVEATGAYRAGVQGRLAVHRELVAAVAAGEEDVVADVAARHAPAVAAVLPGGGG